MSRWENAPDLRALVRMTHAMVNLWCNSYRCPPRAVTLDIDDTADTVHGHQQLSWNPLAIVIAMLPLAAEIALSLRFPLSDARCGPLSRRPASER
jgi:hypothetical protein